MLTYALILLSAAVAQGSHAGNQFDLANDAYRSGDYAAAINLYTQLVEAGTKDPVVFYNLGNAYFQQKQVAPAIVNYERALQLDPGFDNARENLDTAVKATERQLPRPLPPSWEQSLFFWHYRLGPRSTLLWAVGCWILLWITLAVLQWRPVRYLKGVAVLLAVMALGLGASVWLKAHPTQIAVAQAQKVPVRYGMSDEDTVRYELFPGDRVRVDARREGWARVETADGQRGWAKADQLLFVGPPYTEPQTADTHHEDTATP